MGKRTLLGLVALLPLFFGGCGAPRTYPPAPATPTPTATPTPMPVVRSPTPTVPSLPTQAALCPEYALEIELHVSQSYEDFRAEFGGKGRIPLSADLSADPPQLSGTGGVPIAGSGMAGECALVYSGSFAYTISGEITYNEQGEPQVHLVGQTVGQITASSPCSWGGGGPSAPEKWEMWLPYQDGATQTSTATAPGTTAQSTWMLDILCEP